MQKVPFPVQKQTSKPTNKQTEKPRGLCVVPENKHFIQS